MGLGAVRRHGVPDAQGRRHVEGVGLCAWVPARDEKGHRHRGDGPPHRRHWVCRDQYPRVPQLHVGVATSEDLDLLIDPAHGSSPAELVPFREAQSRSQVDSLPSLESSLVVVVVDFDHFGARRPGGKFTYLGWRDLVRLPGMHRSFDVYVVLGHGNHLWGSGPGRVGWREPPTWVDHPTQQSYHDQPVGGGYEWTPTS